MLIAEPELSLNHPDRFSECQMALKDSLIAIIGDASDAGWHNDEILAAIIEITDTMALALNTNTLLAIEIYLNDLMKPR
ncbi:hypothetical protein HB779_21490 (plasmid) [Phyllobacterium sp. 628]|uniref:hypothetical protein n=1 Tax=Phyllobacterium sp. 628 TaxID=2718938 RepID=UPI001662829F|nr:hypothetical protein [Phyllobacterium sp. 628]QND54491.1 hypothetical protein HB779_21490 [Phyllobacterium sp. 628]